ncbi:MAG: phosphoglycerate dehydrogenase [Ilumatobacteraceae bacterium]
MHDHGLTGEVVVTWPGYDIDGAASGRLLQQAGLSIRLEPKLGARTSTELIALLGDAVAVIASNDPFSADVFDACPNLKVIARTGVGVDAIDVPAASRAGVMIATAPGTNEETVADHTLALMLALVRRLVEHDRSLREHRWDRAGGITPNDLVGATVGVIGSGAIGRGVIRRVLAFGSRVLVCDPVLTAAPEGTELVTLDQLLSQSDVVTLHVPLLEQTRGLIGARELALMRPTAVLVNASRGHIVDEAALADALRNHRLAAAGLDVFAEEPPFASELLDLPNVIVTPHVAGISHRAIAAMNEVATRSVIAVLSGDVPANVVNHEAR